MRAIPGAAVQELSKLEQLMAADDRASAAEKFARSMRRLRLVEAPNGDPGLPDPATDAGARSVTLTLAQIDRIEAMLRGSHDLVADSIRLSLDLPLAAVEDVAAGQSTMAEVPYIACSLSTPTTRNVVHLNGGYAPIFGHRNLVAGWLSVDLAA